MTHLKQTLTPEYYRAGIKSYQREMAIIYRVIRREGGALTADRFDEIFETYHRSPNGKLRIRRGKAWPATKDSFILGSFNQDYEWSVWLDLTQTMVRAQLLTIEHHDGKTTYRLNADQ